MRGKLSDARLTHQRDHRALPITSISSNSKTQRPFIPRNVWIGEQEGIFHSFTPPDQLPVASMELSGENLTIDTGRSSPICEPRIEKVWLIIRLRKFSNKSTNHEPSLLQRLSFVYPESGVKAFCFLVFDELFEPVP